MFDDSIMIYELGEEVGNFVEQLPRQCKSLIDSDDLLKIDKVKESLNLFELIDSWMILGSEDYKKGYVDAVKFVMSKLK